MAVSFAKGVLIAANFIGFIVKLIFNKEANTVSRVFPRKTGEVSDKAQTDLTPAAVTFAIWGIIYLLQFAWIVYSLTLIFRQDAPDILPASFFLFYILASFFNVSWLMIWARRKFALSALVLFLITISLGTCLYFAYSGLHLLLEKVGPSQISSIDIWCMRGLVQNGIMFYTAWVSIASCINLAIYLQTSVGISRPRSGTIALILLLSIVICWFVSENYLFRQYTKYTFVEYLVLIIGLSGVLKKQWTDGHGNQAFVLFLLVLSFLMLGARIMIMTMTS